MKNKCNAITCSNLEISESAFKLNELHFYCLKYNLYLETFSSTTYKTNN